jgi:hypothetical protein
MLAYANRLCYGLGINNGKEATMTKQLPPDPVTDSENERRAFTANAALTSFRIITGCDEEDAATDFLANLMHLCAHNGEDFERILDRARMH